MSTYSRVRTMTGILHGYGQEHQHPPARAVGPDRPERVRPARDPRLQEGQVRCQEGAGEARGEAWGGVGGGGGGGGGAGGSFFGRGGREGGGRGACCSCCRDSTPRGRA